MTTRFPDITKKIGLGVGLDMPWGDSFGFDPQTAKPTPRVSQFFKNHVHDFKYGFLSCHRRDRHQLKAENYFAAFDAFFAVAPNWKTRSLHHTFLNLGAVETYEKKQICRFTNTLVQRYNLQWVNEDLGIWSLRGKTLPYPLPPYLTREGLQACILNVNEYQSELAVPLLIEFPGFTDGSNFFVGRLHAYDFFNELVTTTQSPVTLDIGHLISYQWLLGKRGEDLYRDLERLPLQACFEIHLSGCQIVQDRFMDFHHGIIMDEQITLLERLLPLCPNVKVITYEDPKFDATGNLIAKSLPNFRRLQTVTQQWEAA